MARDGPPSRSCATVYVSTTPAPSKVSSTARSATASTSAWTSAATNGEAGGVVA